MEFLLYYVFSLELISVVSGKECQFGYNLCADTCCESGSYVCTGSSCTSVGVIAFGVVGGFFGLIVFLGTIRAIMYYCKRNPDNPYNPVPIQYSQPALYNQQTMSYQQYTQPAGSYQQYNQRAC